MQTSRAKGVDSARRVLQILLSFTEASPEITVEQISARFEISIPSAYRYIALLRELYLIEERRRGVYTLTSQMFRLASVAESSLDIGAIGKPILEQLVEETHETTLILRRVKDSVLCVASVIPDKPAMISFKPGHLMPLHKGAGPKVLLAAALPEKREKYFRKLEQTLSKEEVEELRNEVALAGKLNHAVSAAEVDEGIYAVAAPIIVEGRTVAALSIAGLEFRLDDQAKERLLEKVKLGAREIAELVLAEESAQ
ncbi:MULTISPECIES: IclR family transcriptional regulator [unclassified Leucobacter]|uniref:IclR family transcriptional regulator n=1 Tax=unclassified Leucobacter TaxID=2621730 RepID=UPI00165DDDEC|nr:MULTISPECIES: IclR family transcriptional regulator [unclassified Leucobacter]MBC9926196.1 IclR family transcriptional regulator [Leucobacter sp. cx-169]